MIWLVLALTVGLFVGALRAPKRRRPTLADGTDRWRRVALTPRK